MDRIEGVRRMESDPKAVRAQKRRERRIQNGGTSNGEIKHNGELPQSDSSSTITNF